MTWEQCAALPEKCWATSVVQLDGMVYVMTTNRNGGFLAPFVYDPHKDQWSALPDLPCWYFSLMTVPEKKQLLAVGGMTSINGAEAASNKIFLWDEKYKKWLTPYPNMPTARFCSSAISHGLTVIVACGITSMNPDTITRSVEVLHINDNNLHDSYWSVVDQLPHALFEAIPLIIDDKLYITVGLDSTTTDVSICNVVASLPELLQSSNNNTSISQVWSKLPDMPYSSPSINHYQGCLITFTGGYKVEQTDENIQGGIPWKQVSLIHIYNTYTKIWDCVGDVPYGYLLNRSVHLTENKILFVGGATGSYLVTDSDVDVVTTCVILTLTPCNPDR